jgi:hypothetical protein
LWGRIGEKRGGGECKIVELKGGKEGEKWSKERGRVFYVKAMVEEVTKQCIRELSRERQN